MTEPPGISLMSVTNLKSEVGEMGGGGGGRFLSIDSGRRGGGVSRLERSQWMYLEIKQSCTRAFCVAFVCLFCFV